MVGLACLGKEAKKLAVREGCRKRLPVSSCLLHQVSMMSARKQSTQRYGKWGGCEHPHRGTVVRRFFSDLCAVKSECGTPRFRALVISRLRATAYPSPFYPADRLLDVLTPTIFTTQPPRIDHPNGRLQQMESVAAVGPESR